MQQKAVPQRDVQTVIDAAAREVAWESGLSAVTLRRVSARANLDPGTVARAEPSMTALAARIFRRIALEELQAVTAGATSCGTAVDGLWFVAEHATADSEGNDDWMWAEAWSTGSRNASVAAAAREVNDGWTGLISGLIDRGVQAGEFEAVDSHFVARTVLALIDGSGVRSVFGGNFAVDRTQLVVTFLTRTLGVDRHIS